MCPINPEVIEKLIAAKRLEKEAIELMLPPKVKGHLEVIFSELEAMVLEILLERQGEKTQENGDAKESSETTGVKSCDKKDTSTKVKKIPIG